MKFKLTKQGVRDLSSIGPKAKPVTEVQVYEPTVCDHRQMRECHPGCKHYTCPCGVSWDESAGL